MKQEAAQSSEQKMSRHKCCKAVYKAFLQFSCVRYSSLALSEVSPKHMSHDSVSRWLNSQQLRPREVWENAKELIDPKEPCVLIVDDTVLDKNRSKKIGLVQHQYSGNVHGVVAGIGVVSLLWYGLESKRYIPIDYRVYNKDDDGNKHRYKYGDHNGL